MNIKFIIFYYQSYIQKYESYIQIGTLNTGTSSSFVRILLSSIFEVKIVTKNNTPKKVKLRSKTIVRRAVRRNIE